MKPKFIGYTKVILPRSEYVKTTLLGSSNKELISSDTHAIFVIPITEIENMTAEEKKELGIE